MLIHQFHTPISYRFKVNQHSLTKWKLKPTSSLVRQNVDHQCHTPISYTNFMSIKSTFINKVEIVINISISEAVSTYGKSDEFSVSDRDNNVTPAFPKKIIILAS